MSTSAVARLAARTGTLWSLGARAVSMAASILLTVVTARHFRGEPEALERNGTWGLVFVLLFGAATIARMGAETLALRLTAADPELGAPWRRATLIGQVVLGALAALALVFLVHAQPMIASLPNGWLWAALFATCVIPTNLLSVSGAWLRALGHVPLGSFVELGALPVLAMIGVGVLQVADNKGLGGVLTVFTVAAWSAGVLATIVAVRRLRAAAPGVAQHSVSRYVGEHRTALLSYMLTALGLFFYTYLAVLFFGFIGRRPDAGLYRNALTLANFVGLLATLQVSYLGPRLAALHHHGSPRELHALSWRSTAVATAFAALVAVPLVLFPAQIITLVFGAEYAIADNMLRVLAISALVVVVFGPVSSLLLTLEGMEKTASWVTLGSLAAALVAMILVRPLGPQYIVLASTIAPIGFALASHLVLWRRRGIRSALWQRPKRA